MIKSKPTLYKYTQKGQIQTWQIIVDKDEFYTIEGIKDGKLTTSLPTKCTGKNIGKKNETSPEQQAEAEAVAKWQKKKDNSYNEVLTDKRNFFEPMLAFTYAKEVKVNWDDLKEKGIKVFVQPKLDGLRCVNENSSLMSRNGKPFVACPHLYQHSTTLDGELYTHEYKNDFNKIVSLCKRPKPTEEDIEEASKKVEFWVYDYPSVEGTFSKRYKALEKWVLNQDNQKIRLVPTFEVHSEEDLVEWHAKFIEDGYEGTIVRVDNCNYENKRSKQLLKYKDFIDEEFEIVGAVEGEGGRVGTIGKFWVRLDNSKPYVISESPKDRVNCCKSNVKGNFDYLKDVWKNHKKYIGTEATVKFFGYTPDGALRFPFVIKLNRKSYE